MSYTNEFDNFNTMMLEDYPLRFDEVDNVDPVQFRERVAKIIRKASDKLTFAGITNEERLGLMKIATKGLEAMKFNSHDELVKFYKTTYMDEINKATQSDFFVAQDFNYVADDNADVIIHEQEINETIDQFNAFDPAFNRPSWTHDNKGRKMGMGSLSDVESTFQQYKWPILALAIGAGLFFYSKKKKLS